MRKVFKKSTLSFILRLVTILTIFVTLSDLDFALAGDSITFTVVCTIPLIPGVNAPLLEKEEVRTVTVSAQSSSPALPQGPAVTIVQEETAKDTKMLDGAVMPVLTKTFYSR